MSDEGAPDTVCRIVRCSVGLRQLEALAAAGADAADGDAVTQALMTSAWSRAMPGEPAAGWVRAVQPIEPELDRIVPGEPVLVLVAGLRRDLADAARGGDDRAAARLQAAREAFGHPHRAEIMGVLAQALARTAGEAA